MSNHFHDSALIFELFQLFSLDNLSLNFFNCNDRVLPSALVHDAVAAFRELPIKRNFVVGDFEVLRKVPPNVIFRLIHNLQKCAVALLIV